MTKIETVTIVELNNYVLTLGHKYVPSISGLTISLLFIYHDCIHITILHLLTSRWWSFSAPPKLVTLIHGWCYISCYNFYQKLQPGFTSFTCGGCHDDNVFGCCKVLYFHLNFRHSICSMKDTLVQYFTYTIATSHNLGYVFRWWSPIQQTQPCS